VEVRLASLAAPDGTENEDYIVALPQLVGVFDGVTAPAGLETGCVHGPAWYVRRLATQLARRYASGPQEALPELLAGAIQDVRPDHDGRCDLNHPGTPASTVTVLRESAGSVEYLVLCDSPLVFDRGGAVQVVTDQRHAAAIGHVGTQPLSGGSAVDGPEHAARLRRLIVKQREYTNQPGGYWIAAADPHAAYESCTGILPLTGADRVRRAALLTDGASSAVDQFGLFDWQGLLDLVTTEGPRALIGRVRAAELADPEGQAAPRTKLHDDATVAICLFDGEYRG
jgi:hypothetical protein